MDLTDLVHFHFHGTKNVTLFAPDQAQYLYKVPYTVNNLECIDMDYPDFEKYPILKQVRGLHVKINHGDALYMPSVTGIILLMKMVDFPLHFAPFQEHLKV